jgi:hypothetical protein
VSWLLFLACTELTPGERVLGDEVVATELRVASGQGRVLGLFGDGLISTDTPVMGDWRSGVLEAGDVGAARRVGHGPAGAWAWLGDGRVVSMPDGEVLAELGQPTGVDRCPDGEVVAVYGVGEAIACGDAGELSTACDGSGCEVQGSSVSDRVSPGGAVAWIDGVACWGDPMLHNENGTGAVRCEDGTEVTGLEGDHLGLSLSAGRTAGRYNRHIVPPRLRIVSLAGEETWLIDSAAENSRVGLSGDGEHTAVGVPDFRRSNTGGRIYVVAAP